ncbi:MAG: hypothetical protein IKO80_03820 [Lachnospiraceae bacterium]|nr:hypothetical protein [Lachnospiraceae bacterium]
MAAAGKKMSPGPVKKPEAKPGAKPIVIKEDQKTKKLDQAPEEVLAMAIREMMRK